MTRTAFAILVSLALTTACSQDQSADSQAMPGSDADEHGCIQSAGYSWCAKTESCERPWELAESAGFENTAEAFESYCGE